MPKTAGQRLRHIGQTPHHLASRRGLSENRWPHGLSVRAVDAEGEVLDVPVQTKRNKRAALKLMRKLLKKYGFVPDKLITDDLRLQPVILESQSATGEVDG